MNLNEYKIVWIMVFFDLPTETEKDRKNYVKFRTGLLKDGFSMYQFSIYIRHCPSYENANVHIKRVKSILPIKGKVGIMTITDKQFGLIELYDGKIPEKPKQPTYQLEMF
jgi:CRISPR-associated protein Cas2